MHASSCTTNNADLSIVNAILALAGSSADVAHKVSLNLLMGIPREVVPQ